ncbi:MAG: cobyrinate a,c-diamide synthase [Hyphomicrobiaceae bacterium]
MAHLLVSASHKSSGKTTISVGLTAALAAKGHGVQTFKKGPDYIDPMWLSRASNRPCFNLDFNTQTHPEIRQMFASRARTADVALIEGNMGLHDGVDEEGADSTAALARLLGAPVVLAVDCEGMTRGVAPLVLGFQAFDRTIKIAGLVLNRVATARQEAKLVAAIERYTDIPVLGALRRSSELTIVERHLGLTTPNETAGNDAKIALLGSMIAANVDLNRILDIAGTAVPLASDEVTAAPPRIRRGVSIAVARDSAFGFYYADDLEALERAGATLNFFSPISDTHLPEADGIFIGGGFPETHMAALEANAAMRGAIKRAARNGVPIYAECGGLMYLTRSIRWRDETREMVGVIAADTVMHSRPQGRGLVVLEPTGTCRWSGNAQTPDAVSHIRAHEFHHAQLINIASGTNFAWRVARGFGIDGQHDGIIVDNVLASFSHQRSTEANRWAERFVGFVRGLKRSRLPARTARDIASASVRQLS